ncbi:MAG: hypothetical protein ABIJ57_02565 [Pseudomonadota bacterium]
MLTASTLIDQAMQAGGNTRISTWCLAQLNLILRQVYRTYSWPFLHTMYTSLATVASQAYTDYSALTDFWKPLTIQLLTYGSTTQLNDVRPLKGGLSAYYADTSRLLSSGRPSHYVLDRSNSYIRWADSIPNAVETIHLFYQKEVADITLTDTPALLTYTRNAERYLYLRLLQEVKLYMKDFAEAAAMGPLIKLAEDEMMAERRDDEDETPVPNGNGVYA